MVDAGIFSPFIVVFSSTGVLGQVTVVAKLLTFGLDLSFEKVEGLKVVDGLSSWMFPNRGSDSIFTCLSMKSTRLGNVA